MHMISATELFVRRYDELTGSLSPRDDFEAVKIGAVLRQLLMDETPLVIRVNQAPQLRIRFEVNQLGSIDSLPVKPAALFHAHGLDPLVFQIPGRPKHLKLDQFLREPIIETPDQSFTVGQIIKYAANKAGGVHFDPAREPEEASLEQALDRIRALGVQSFVIALVTIARLVLRALGPLRAALVTLPPGLPLFGHYRVPAGSRISFEGNGQFLQIPLAHEIQEGLSWNAVMRLSNPSDGMKVIYALGREDAAHPKLTLSLGPPAALIAEAQLAPTTSIQVEASDFKRSQLWDRYAYIGVDLCYAADHAGISLFLNNVLVGRKESGGSFTSRSVTKQVVGADLDGQNSAAFQIRELVIATRCLSDQERAALAQYFWLQWHDYYLAP